MDLDEDELGGRFSWTAPPVPDRVEVGGFGFGWVKLTHSASGWKTPKKTMRKNELGLRKLQTTGGFVVIYGVIYGVVRISLLVETGASVSFKGEVDSFVSKY